MGYSNTITDQMTINVIVDEIMNMYSLVMITEYMEESLILMAHTFNWSLDDVRFFSVNKNANSEERRDGELVAKVNAWSAADAALYARANETFWRKIDEYGVDRMSVAKQDLMRRNQELFDHCVDKLVTIKRTDIMKKKQLAKLKPDDPRFVILCQSINNAIQLELVDCLIQTEQRRRQRSTMSRNDDGRAPVQ